VTCRICKIPIAFTNGLDEMADHWAEDHPEALARLRKALGHEEEA
jgi:hypothetical protein